MNLSHASCRVALAAYLHDLGKLAQRADLAVAPETLRLHQQMYCPIRTTANGGTYHTHLHGAYTALGFEAIESALPDCLLGETAPFVGLRSEGATTDSLINAAASHHKPETFLQWVIATADRVSSGFERELLDVDNADKEPDDHYRARLRSLLEQVHLPENGDLKKRLNHVYPLRPSSVAGLFPESDEGSQSMDRDQARKEYRRLWNALVEALKPGSDTEIPASHRNDLALWLDHFDSAWLAYTASIPSATAFGVVPDVSLYDHSKSTAALAVALWRWHHANGTDNMSSIAAMRSRSDWDEEKMLLVQGDFFGIQDFIFAQGSSTNKESAKLLRGRSFYVSLITELAALKVLDALDLPPTSQITNAAGKFLILTPNTSQAREAIGRVQKELDEWFLANTLGQCGLGLASVPVSCNDFVVREDGRNFSLVMKRLFEVQEEGKLTRFDLSNRTTPIVPVDYSKGVSNYDEHLPATSPLPEDQKEVGRMLVKSNRLLVFEGAVPRESPLKVLKLPIFGYTVAFGISKEIERLQFLSPKDGVRRYWDFSMPQADDEVLWQGCARRSINGYVAKCGDDVKTFEELARGDRDETVKQGQVALSVLKGDVDNLGRIFQTGLTDDKERRYLSFAKMAGLSRHLNAFFAVYVPLLCRQSYPDTYTVFAGGDDFFMIGPWYQTQRLALDLQRAFTRFVTNEEVHFSAGVVMVKPDIPPRTLARMADEALEAAKVDGKNRVTVFGQTVAWDRFERLQRYETLFEAARSRFNLSAGYFYSLFQLLEMAGQTDRPTSSMWRSKLFYRTVRMADKRSSIDRTYLMQEFLPELVQAIDTQKSAMRIPLSNYFYKLR